MESTACHGVRRMRDSTEGVLLATPKVVCTTASAAKTEA